MRTYTDLAEFDADPIPGVLTLRSNRSKIPNFPLICTRIDELPSKRIYGRSPEISLVYRVRKPEHDNKIPDGKLYRRHSENTVSIEVPISRFAKIECSYTSQADSAVLEVNPTYHLLGRMTLGNVHSVGWLLRDLLNIRLLLNKYALLHAAALQSRDACVVAVGLSNTGKTTTSFDLTLNSPCKLFGDDLVATDGANIFACPYTATNVSPSQLAGVGSRSSQWLFRNIPFYGNYGPTRRVPVISHIGDSKMADPTRATHVVFLRRSSVCATSRLQQSAAHSLLTASNRTEFTFMNSPLFSAFDYLNDTTQLPDAIRNEEEIFDSLLESTDCLLVEGDIPYFKGLISELVGT